ncbi:peptidase s41 family protein [Anaeramoeba flamelloides]|uniref:Peptidase s41 family protein n=1 Tax=Anaeramoeba flamelloides TaxID=1746091 RepID=A0ABQ8X7W5_9EUKA|nr:peptidase s41 family protein [Anaeramoeba flamelloides]
MDSFKNTVDECFDYLSQNNVEYLIIDVRENGGGYIELGHELFYYLFENQKGKFTPKISNNDVIHSPLHDEFFTKCAQDEKGKEDDTMPFSPKSWYDVNENQFETIELYSPGKEYHRGGGLPQSFSTFFHENVDFLWENKNKLYYDKHHLLILSDGRCGSTCAIFTSKVFQNGLAKTITIGGNGNKTVNASAISFPGGQVLDDYFFHIVYLYFVDNLKIPIDNMFDEYPSDQSLSFTWREIYPMDKNPDESNPIPMEFQFYPSDIHIFNWDFNNDESIIAESVTHFNFSSYKPTPTPTYTPSPTPTSSPTTTANPTTKDDTNMKSFKVGISILAILLIISFIFIIFLFINIRKLKHKNHHELLEGQTDDSEDEFEFELESAKNSNIDNENDDENTFESEKENSDQEDQENDKLIN